MGHPIVIAFGVLTAVGVILLAVGVLREKRTMAVAGTGILLALAGSWIFGLPGLAVGLLALAFLKRGSASS